MSWTDLIGRIETARNNFEGARTQLSHSRAIIVADITSHQNTGVPIDCTPEPRPGMLETVGKGTVDGAKEGIFVGAGIGAAVGLAPLLTGPGAVVTPATVAKGIVTGAVIGGVTGAAVGATAAYLNYELESLPDTGCPTLPPTE